MRPDVFSGDVEFNAPERVIARRRYDALLCPFCTSRFLGRVQARSHHNALRAKHHRCGQSATVGSRHCVAQGGETGGHGISQGSITLVSAVVDALDCRVPVLLAGGAFGYGINSHGHALHLANEQCVGVLHASRKGLRISKGEPDGYGPGRKCLIEEMGPSREAPGDEADAEGQLAGGIGLIKIANSRSSQVESL
jgi:hypothetical protein